MAPYPELLPEAEVSLTALWYLAALCAFAAAFGLITVVKGFIDGLFWILRKIVSSASFGLLGGVPGQTGAQRAISHALGAAIAPIEAQLGRSWHELARVVDHIGRELYGLAVDTLLIAEWVATHSVGAEVFAKHTQHHAHRSKVEAAKAAKAHATSVPWEVWRHGIGADVLPRIHVGERKAAGTIEADIAALRKRTKALEDGALDAFKWIKAHPLSLGATAFAAAVAIALQRLGGSWIRCRNWNRIGRAVCGSPITDIEALVGLLATGAVIADFRELVKLAQSVERGTAAALQDIAKL